LKRRDLLGDIASDRRIILKMVLKNWGLKLWSVFFWVRVGISGGRVGTWH
jgi:hypothetical protein